MVTPPRLATETLLGIDVPQPSTATLSESGNVQLFSRAVPQPSTTTISRTGNEQLLLERVARPTSTATPSRIESKLLCRAVPPSTAPPSTIEEKRLLCRAVPPTSTAITPQLEEQAGKKSKWGTVPKCQNLSKKSGNIKSGTPGKEASRKCSLSDSGNLKHRVDQPTSSTSSMKKSLSSSIGKSVVKKSKISSKISEIRKLCLDLKKLSDQFVTDQWGWKSKVRKLCKPTAQGKVEGD